MSETLVRCGHPDHEGSRWVEPGKIRCQTWKDMPGGVCQDCCIAPDLSLSRETISAWSGERVLGCRGCPAERE